MSKAKEYMAHARRVFALADRIGDPLTRESLRQAGDSWRLLAEMEAEGDWPTRWDGRRPSRPRGVYDHFG